jgi:hypothetical protein
MPVPQLFEDLFTRGDSSSLGVMWSEQRGDWDLISNQLRFNGTLTNHAVLSLLGSFYQLADARVEVTDPFAGAFDCPGPAARIGSGGDPNLYGVWLNGTTVQLQVWKRVGGVDTQLGSSVGVTRVQGAKIRLDLIGSRLRVYYNGTLTHDLTDTAITAAGAPGVYTRSTGANVRTSDFTLSGDLEWNYTPNAWEPLDEFLNEVVDYESGWVQRNGVWTRPRGIFVLGYEVASDSELKAMRERFLFARGRLGSVRIPDPTGQNPTEEFVAIADGVATKYKILSDVAATITTYTNGVVDSPQPTIDYFSGTLTYSSAPQAGAVLTADCTLTYLRGFFQDDQFTRRRRPPTYWHVELTFVQDKTLLDGVAA